MPLPPRVCLKRATALEEWYGVELSEAIKDLKNAEHVVIIRMLIGGIRIQGEIYKSWPSQKPLSIHVRRQSGSEIKPAPALKEYVDPVWALDRLYREIHRQAGLPVPPPDRSRWVEPK